MEELLEKLMAEGWGQHVATAAAAGIIGGAAVLGGAYKAEKERPVEPSPSTVRAEEPKVEEPRVEEPNEPAAKKEIVRMLVTAYCPCAKCCGTGSPGITANGHKIQSGDTFVAADKRYAFGTEMVIPGYNKGQSVEVLDRGGAIKGNHIDVFFPTHQEALNWGVQNLDVEILRGVTEARGHWRNWEEIQCLKCFWRDYKKNFAKRKESIPKICPKCGAELKT